MGLSIINYSQKLILYEIGASLSSHAGLEDDECDLESWTYRLEFAWDL
jgi:hypothetical protein